MDTHAKKRLKYGLLLPALLLVAFLVDSFIRGPKAREKQTAIESALSSISDPKTANPVRSVSGYKTSNGYAKRILVTNASTDDIRQFYKARFEEQGWTSYGASVRLGKETAYFCRDGDTARVELPESASGGSFEYFVEVSWGIAFGCEAKQSTTY